MERSLYITRYRNMGIKKPQRFVLNSFADKEHLGNLVIIVGPNNSGKSNILAALKSFGNKTFSDGDFTTLSFEEKDSIPQLSLSCKGEMTEDSEYTYRITYNAEPFVKYPPNQEMKYLSSKDDLPMLLMDWSDLIESFLNAGRQMGHSISTNAIPDLIKFGNDLSKQISENSPVNLSEAEAKVKDLAKYFLQVKGNSIYSLARQAFVLEEKHSKFVQCFLGDESGESILNNIYKNEYGMDFFPRIIQYKDEAIGNQSVMATRSNFTSNKFFVKLFSGIDYPIESLSRAYAAFQSTHTKGILSTQESEINNKLKKVAADFNRLYNFDSSKYRFEISLESDNIFFSIFNGTAACSLERQSTGFRWFFDLYFNLLCGNSISKGDVILMDEPATNLHVQGQRELRKFLKDFAIKNNITIVLATHSPFLVDIDYLDELRVVESNDGEAFINNDFSAISLDDPDSLLPIKQALTVDSCHLYDPDKKVVFVEGITDYNYLTAFKKILNIEEDIIFLPIHGVGNSAEEQFKNRQKQISKRLIDLRKRNPILLVDGDEAGKAMKDVNSSDSELVVITLNDVDNTFKTIESLFDGKDLKKYNIVDSDGKFVKHNSTSAAIKTYASEYKFTEVTKNNFKKLFDKLIAL